MTGKVAWLFLWVTMTLWLGSFWGCAADPGKREVGSAYMFCKQSAPPALTPVRLSDALSRENWPRAPFAPESGITTHRPTYIDSPAVRDNDHHFDDPWLDVRMAAALVNPYGHIDNQDITDALVEPLCFVWHIVRLPVMLFIQPPLSDQTTP